METVKPKSEMIIMDEHEMRKCHRQRKKSRQPGSGKVPLSKNHKLLEERRTLRFLE